MNDLPALTLAPADLFRRAAAWLIDVLIVGLLFVIPFAASLPRIEGCTWDAEALTFPDECVFKTSRMVERDDGTTEQVYVFDDGQEISASTPTLQTAIFGEFIISSSPGPAAYLIPFFYILAVWIGVQGLLGFTPGKAVMGLRLANEEGRAAGVVPAFIRWLVIDGGIGLLGLLVALVDGPTFVRFLAANGALGLIGGIYALVTAGRRTGDHAAHTLVIDETLFRRPERPERPDHDDATGYDQPSSPDQLPTVAASTTDVPAVGAAFGTAVGATSGATAFGDTGSGEDADQDRSPRLTPRRRPDQPEPVQPAPGWGDPAPAVPIPDSPGLETEPGWQPQPAPPWPPVRADLPDLPQAPSPADLPSWAADTPSSLPQPALVEPEPAAATNAAAGFSIPPSFPNPPGVGDQTLDEPAPVEPAPVAVSAPVNEPTEPTEPTEPIETPTLEAAATTTAVSAREPQWNEEREAWMVWDNDRQEWLQFDEEIGSWLHYDAARAVWVALAE